MQEESLEIDPLTIHFSGKKSEFTLQNLTLHYIAIKIYPPPMFHVYPSQCFIDPCSTQEIRVQVDLSGFFNHSNAKIHIFSHDIEEFEGDIQNYEVQWDKCEIIKNNIQVDMKFDKQRFTQKLILYDHVIVAQKIQLTDHQQELTEKEKKAMLQSCFAKLGSTENYSIARDLIIFNYPTTNKLVKSIENDIEIIRNDYNFVFSIFKPSGYYLPPPKYNIERISPQQVKRKQKKFEFKEEIDLTQSIKSQPNFSDGEQTPKILSLDQRRLSEKQIQIPLKISVEKKKNDWQLFMKKQQFENESTPVIRVEEKEENIDNAQSLHKMVLKKNNQKQLFKEVAKFQTYQKNIKFVIIIEDLVVTIDEKSVMKIWNIKMNSEVGILSNQEGQKIQKALWWRNEKRLVTWSENSSQFWIYNIESVKLENKVQVQDVSNLNTMCFISDRQYCCIGAMPKKQFTFLGNRFPKHRYLKFFCMDNLKELRSFKLKCENDEDILSHTIYTDNDDSVKHARLNNILVVLIGKQILVLFVDMELVCTILMNLSLQQLDMKHIKDIYYLQQQAKFAFVCDQKVMTLNLKQVKTNHGMKNGLECKYFDEENENFEILIIPQMDYILKVKGSNFIIIDLKNGQIGESVLLSDYDDRTFHLAQEAKVIRVFNEVVGIYDLLF